MVVIQTYENVFLGITGSMWIMFILALFCVILLFVIFTIIYMAGPSFGYIKARFQQKPNVAIVIQNHDITIKSMDYFAGVFEKMGLTWLQKKSENHNYGVCNCELIADFWGVTLDAKKMVAVKAFIDRWNDPNYIDDSYPAPDERILITDPDSLYAALDECKNEDEIKIRAFSYVPVYALKNYLPKIKADDLTGYIEAMKKVEKEKVSSQAASWLPLICLIVGIAIGIGIKMI